MGLLGKKKKKKGNRGCNEDDLRNSKNQTEKKL